MARKNSKNNDFLNEAKKYSNPKVYFLILNLVNEDKNELAEIVYKIDYLLRYATNSAKANDLDESREALTAAKNRIAKLKENSVNTEHLDYLIDVLLKNYPKLKK